MTIHHKFVAKPFDLEVPPGTIFGGIRFTVEGPTAVPTQTVAAAPYELVMPDDAVLGDYIVTAVAVDAAGQTLGSPVTSTLTLAAPEVVDAPQSLAVVAY